MDFDCIYKSYYLDVYHFLCGLSSNKEIAEDITQETFTKALAAIDSYDGRKDIRAWLFTIARSYNTATFRDSKNNVNVLKGISFQVAEGEFVGIMGKSGCGKTTLLKTLGMIDKPTDGTIKFMGEDTSELYGDKLADIRNSKIGFIFQDFYLMDSLSVEENIMLPMIISKQNISTDYNIYMGNVDVL